MSNQTAFPRTYYHYLKKSTLLFGDRYSSLKQVAARHY